MTAYISTMEVVATDGNTDPGTADTVPTIWGGHQPRITVHPDEEDGDTIRILYLRYDSGSSSLKWRLMKRDPLSPYAWSEEYTAATTDDSFLVRDNGNNKAYVLGWPDSVPTMYVEGSSSAVPGGTTWGDFPEDVRHYCGAGISLATGTFVLKTSKDNGGGSTADTSTLYITGNYTSSWSWSLSSPVEKPIGLRCGYDILFPNPGNEIPNGIVGVSQSDVRADVLDPPYLSYGTNYVFIGTKYYYTGLADDTDWTEQTHGRIEDTAVATTTTPPKSRLRDAFIDSKGRTFSIYYFENDVNNAILLARGFYLLVTDYDGTPQCNPVFLSGTDQIPDYGNCRIFQDASDRFFIIWANENGTDSSLFLYPLYEAAGYQQPGSFMSSPGSYGGGMSNSKRPDYPSFTLGAYTDLSSALTYGGDSYAVADVSVYLAVPRGGNVMNSSYVDMIIHTFNDPYSSGPGGTIRVHYARLMLP